MFPLLATCEIVAAHAKLNISTAKGQHWTGFLGLADSPFDKLGMRPGSLIARFADPTSKTQHILIERLAFRPPQHSLWFPSMPITLNPFLSIREMNSCRVFYLLLVRHMKASHLTQVCESSQETWGPRAPCVLASLIIIFHAAEAHRAHPPVSPTVSCF